jgi:hypothetical protein
MKAICVINLERFFLKKNFMKKIYTFFAVIILFNVTSFAQNDTLLFENFNTGFDTLSDDTDGVRSAPSGNDLIWVNYDGDNMLDASGKPQNWYWQSEWLGADTLTQGGVLVSSSWLANNANGAQNWLMLPPLHLPDATGKLSWKSAPFQGPRYMDGYKVVISVFDNDTIEFTDEVFLHAQMTAQGADTVISQFTFSNGYIHADGYTNSNYFFYSPVLNGYHGLLEPHTISLAAYAGYTIYIAFVHESDDDNLMALDDILVTGTYVVSNQEVENIKAVSIAPNPVKDFIQLNYTTEIEGNVDVRIFDMQGRIVKELHSLPNHVGQNNQTIDVARLAKGSYQLVLIQNGKQICKSFVKL